MTPPSFQALKYRHTVSFGGKSCGNCRHEQPVRFRYRIASTIRRREWPAGRPPGRGCTIAAIPLRSVRSDGHHVVSQAHTNHHIGHRNLTNNTRVMPQPVHRDRRGHNHTGPSGPRSCRGLAHPQPRQHTTTRRATQLTRCQPALDLIDIRLYGDHCASKRNRRPSRKTPPETCREGRRLQRRDHRAAPTPQAPTQVRPVGEPLTVNAGSQPPGAQPECLRTALVGRMQPHLLSASEGTVAGKALAAKAFTEQRSSYSTPTCEPMTNV